MKGILLAGGKGTRLYPLTAAVSKQLLPVYDKPLIYYPLSVLMLAKIKDILLITTAYDLPAYQRLLGDGSRFGIRITYQVQEEPRGIADAFLVGEEFIGKDPVCLVLGDNLFYGQGFTSLLLNAITHCEGATIFGCPVNNPSDFGVVELSEDGKAVSLEEKPENPKSPYAVPGLYVYDNSVVSIAKSIRPSERGELEITAVNNVYLKKERLQVVKLGRGMIWMDTGTPDGLMRACSLVESVQSGGYYVACLEEIAWRNGFITDKALYEMGKEYQMSDYGQYLLRLLDER